MNELENEACEKSAMNGTNELKERTYLDFMAPSSISSTSDLTLSLQLACPGFKSGYLY